MGAMIAIGLMFINPQTKKVYRFTFEIQSSGNTDLTS
jgi:hypothetical protein